jgi:hypothetical protein
MLLSEMLGAGRTAIPGKGNFEVRAGMQSSRLIGFKRGPFRQGRNLRSAPDGPDESGLANSARRLGEKSFMGFLVNHNTPTPCFLEVWQLKGLGFL